MVPTATFTGEEKWFLLILFFFPFFFFARKEHDVTRVLYDLYLYFQSRP